LKGKFLNGIRGLAKKAKPDKKGKQKKRRKNKGCELGGKKGASRGALKELLMKRKET